ncbi:hypothetical protein [Gordonia malaquae]|uniref:hypothetical protein n=1 Tax=Gordonia malaquae TaxID=410332 RepID=UPI0030182EAA
MDEQRIPDEALIALADLADHQAREARAEQFERDVNEANVERAIHLREEGVSLAAIANSLNIDAAVLGARILRRRSATGTAQRAIDYRNDSIVRAYEAGMSPKTLATTFDVRTDEVFALLNRRGITISRAERDEARDG